MLVSTIQHGVVLACRDMRLGRIERAPTKVRLPLILYAGVSQRMNPDSAEEAIGRFIKVALRASVL